MIRLVVFFVSLLTLQGVVTDVTKYDDDFSFVNVWKESETEIKQVTLHLKNIEDDEEYVKIVITQSQKLAIVIGDVINSLRQKTEDHEIGDIIFKRVMYLFQEVHNSLNQIVLQHNSSKSFDLKNKLIYNLEVVCENMQQLVYIAKTYCPQLRAVLRSLLVDFLKCVQGFRNTNGILEQNVIIYESPKRMVTQIQVLTQEFTKILGECNHIEEIRIVLRGFTRYVEEILQKIYTKATFGSNEIDLAVKDFSDRVQKMLVPLRTLLTSEDLNVPIFRSEVIAHLFNVNVGLDQLLQLVNSELCPTDTQKFLETIIYYYYYAIKQTHFEIKTAYKNAFYGYDFHNEFLLEEGTKLNDNFASDSNKHSDPGKLYDTLLSNFEQPPIYEIEKRIYTPYSNLNEEEKYRFEDYSTSLENSLDQDVVYQKIPLYHWETGTKPDTLEIETPKELMLQIQKLFKEIVNQLHNPLIQSTQGDQVNNYFFVEFFKVLEYVIDKIEKEIKVGHLTYTEPAMENYVHYLKNVNININNNPKGYRFETSVQSVLTELYKIVIVEKMEKHGFEHVLIKDICFQFLTFLRNTLYKINLYNYESFPKSYSNEKLLKPHEFVVVKIIRY